jgi:hypothetical protein
MRIDPAAALRDALDVLSRAEVERARAVAEAATQALGNSSIALRAEAASYLLAMILAEIGNATKRDDLSDVLPTVEGLAMYVVGRMTTILTEVGNGAGQT